MAIFRSIYVASITRETLKKTEITLNKKTEASLNKGENNGY